MSEAERYARDVVEGKQVAGKLMALTCERFLSDLKRKDIFFDVDEANRVCKFIENEFRLWEDPFRGKPVILYPWQKFIIQNIFAWKWSGSGLRRFRIAYIQVARKNGKTHFADFISLIHLFIDRDKTPQILVGANNEDQAKICTNSMAKILEASPVFREMLNEDDKKLSIYKYKGRAHTILYKEGDGENDRDGSVMAMSKEANTKDGFNPSGGVIDEFWAANTEELLNSIESGQGARSEPFLVVITTAGYDKSLPCFTNLRNSSKKILEGSIEDDTQFAAIYELDTDDDWKDSLVWEKANPMLPYVPTILPYLKARYVKAKNEGGSKEVDFKTKNLDMWTDSAEVWIQDEIWVANHNPKIKVEDLEGAKCWAGLDLAQTRDLNSFGLLFELEMPWSNEKIFPTLNWNWIPEDNIIYRGQDYTKWVQQEFIETTDGNHSDPKLMLSRIIEIDEQYNILKLHYDRYLNEWLAPMLADSGMNVSPVSMKGFSLSQAMKEMEMVILSHRLEHFENPVLRWANSNLMPKRDHLGNIRPTKENEAQKIDPMMALILSFDAKIAYEADPIHEIYIGGF